MYIVQFSVTDSDSDQSNKQNSDDDEGFDESAINPALLKKLKQVIRALSTLRLACWVKKFSRHIVIFPQKIGFDISCKLSPEETICMK